MARESWIAWVSAAVLGLLLWTIAAVVEMRVEPWDAPSYWTIFYPAALALSGLLAMLFPQRPWRWALTVMLMQLVVMAAGGSGFNLLPLGVILVAVLSLPAIGLAYLCAWARHHRRNV